MFTIPGIEELETMSAQVPKEFRPNNLPTAVVFPAYLTSAQCDEIGAEYKENDPYKMKGCGAHTRECFAPLYKSLGPVEDIGLALNAAFWQFDLDRSAAAWHQTYIDGSDYHEHTDAYPGQMRKLTVVAMLSDPDHYEGGHLELLHTPRTQRAPRAKGTVVVFPGWVLHRVTEVTSGIRETVNLGFWGPNFR